LPTEVADLAASIVLECTRRSLTIAVAESLTGGLVVAELVAVPGASAVVLGGVVAYNTAIKSSLLGVDEVLLADRGAVDPDVAVQMATGVRSRMAVAQRPADIGISTTGVAGPEPQDGQPVGTVYLGISTASGAKSIELHLTGTRSEIRLAVVRESLLALHSALSAS
jgi:nicotinamide-nucleotide amidase